MLWDLYEQLKRTGRRNEKPQGVKGVTLQTDKTKGMLYAFQGERVAGEIYPLVVEFTLEGILVRGYAPEGPRDIKERLYAQVWWLEPSPGNQQVLDR